MILRENLSTPPFLDHPLSAFYPLSTEIFETLPFQAILGNSNPPFRKGGPSYVGKIAPQNYLLRAISGHRNLSF